MKIGILTFQHARNFGALLQCYALQEILKKEGYDVSIIDYRQKNIDNSNKFNYKLIIKYIIKLRPLATYYTFKAQWKKLKGTINYKIFANNFFLLTRPCQNTNIPNFDKYIIGSDQVWSLACTGNELDETYFGNFNHLPTSTLIGYAISTNMTSLNCLGSNNLRKYISNFNYVSFREKEIANKIEDFTGIKYPVVLDPTLLATAEIYTPLINNKWHNKKYIVTYNLRGYRNEINNEAQKIALEYGYEIIDLSFSKNKVTDFISIIKHSRIVITSSFHATVFAIIFHKPLYAIKLNDGHDDRYVNLLQTLKMNDCLCNIHYAEKPYPSINWSEVESILAYNRKESQEYLINSLK